MLGEGMRVSPPGGESVRCHPIPLHYPRSPCEKGVRHHGWRGSHAIGNLGVVTVITAITVIAVIAVFDVIVRRCRWAGRRPGGWLV